MKAKYLLPCSCGREISIEASQAGQQIRCRCGATVEVPGMRDLGQLKRAPAKPLDPTRTTPSPSEVPRKMVKPPPGRPISIWGTRQRVLFVGAVVFFLGLGTGMLFYLGRPRIIDAELMSPYESWRFWHDLSRGVEQGPLWEEMYLASLANYHRWMVVAAAIAGTGLLVMASSLLLPRKRRGQRGPKPARRARNPGQTGG